MSRWLETTLGEVVDIFDHKRVPLSSAQRADRPGPYPYYGAQGIIDSIDDFIFDGRFILIPEDGENLRSRRLPIAYFAAGQFWVNNHAHIVKAKPAVANDRFVQSALEASNIGAFITGAAQPKLSQANLRQISILLPSLEEQELIARVLDAIDDVIENNRRRTELLEQMAQAIYREWFVRFRYPGHEAAPLVDSPLGPIPEGWEVRPLDELATIVRGRSYRKHELVESGGVPFVNLKCMMRGGGFRRDGLKRYGGQHNTDQHVSEGDIVLAVTDLTQGREILARATLVPRLRDEYGVISLDVVRIVSMAPECRLALYFALRCTDFPERVKEFANGSTVLHLSPTHVAEGSVLWPGEQLRRRFVPIVEPMVSQVSDLNDAADRLVAIRDLLLPKLVTGQIDVSELDLDAVVGSVA